MRVARQRVGLRARGRRPAAARSRPAEAVRRGSRRVRGQVRKTSAGVAVRMGPRQAGGHPAHRRRATDVRRRLRQVRRGEAGAPVRGVRHRIRAPRPPRASPPAPARTPRASRPSSTHGLPHRARAAAQVRQWGPAHETRCRTRFRPQMPTLARRTREARPDVSKTPDNVAARTPCSARPVGAPL